MAKEGFTQSTLKKAHPHLYDLMMETKGEKAPEGCYNTYVNFFRGTAQFPKFKSRKHKNTFTIPQFVVIKDGKIFIPKFKDGIKVKSDKSEIKGKVGKMNIIKTPTGKYYVSIFTEQTIEQLPKTNKQVGIDLGLKDFVITSDGIKFKNNRYTKKYSKQRAFKSN